MPRTPVSPRPRKAGRLAFSLSPRLLYTSVQVWEKSIHSMIEGARDRVGKNLQSAAISHFLVGYEVSSLHSFESAPSSERLDGCPNCPIAGYPISPRGISSYPLKTDQNSRGLRVVTSGEDKPMFAG